jgi:hypothetical protein
MWLSVLIQSESARYDNTAREDSPGLLLEGSPGRKGAGRGDFFGGTPGKKPEGDIPPGISFCWALCCNWMKPNLPVSC